MRIFAVAFVVVIVFWSAVSVSAQDSKAKDGKKKVVGKPVKLTEQEKAAADFKFGSLKLGMSLKEVREIFPKMEEVKGTAFTNKKAGRLVYILRAAKPADFIYAFFFEDKMYEMRVVYSHPQLSKIGGGGLVEGATILVGKLRKKFGVVSKIQVSKDKLTSELIWKFSKVKRQVYLRVVFKQEKLTDSYTRLDITNSDLQAKVAAKVKDVADTGF